MANEIPEIKIGTTMSELKSLAESTPGLREGAKNSIFSFIEDEEKCSGDGVISNTVELTMIKSFLADLKVDNRGIWEKLFGCGDDGDSVEPSRSNMPEELDPIRTDRRDSVSYESHKRAAVIDEATGKIVDFTEDYEEFDENGEPIFHPKETVTTRTITDVRDNNTTDIEIISETIRPNEDGQYRINRKSRHKFTSVQNNSDATIEDTLYTSLQNGVSRNRKVISENGTIEYLDSKADGDFDSKTVTTEQGQTFYTRDENGNWVLSSVTAKEDM